MERTNNKYIVRCDRSGVFYGEIEMNEQYVGKEVNLGCFTHLAIFLIALCGYLVYDDVISIAKDARFIRQHIENSTLGDNLSG